MSVSGDLSDARLAQAPQISMLGEQFQIRSAGWTMLLKGTREYLANLSQAFLLMSCVASACTADKALTAAHTIAGAD